MKCLKAFLLGTVSGATLGGGISAGLGAAAGATGAAILSSAGHDGYDVTEAAQMGAIGNGILGAGAGAIAGALSASLASCGLFGSSDDEKKNGGGTALSYVGGMVLGGLTGYGVMNAATSGTIMSLANTAAAFAVGGAVTMIPASCVMICVALPLTLGALTCAKSFTESDEDCCPTTVSNRV